MSKKDFTPKYFLLDVDGVLTTGHFLYSTKGKVFKIFGPDDNDALGLLSDLIEIHFITADSKGYEISKKRIEEDMNYKLTLVNSQDRLDWIKKNYNPKNVIFMGDGIFDGYVMQNVGYSIAPSNADQRTKNIANYVTLRAGGDRAVAEACIHILNNFFNTNNLPNSSSLLKFIRSLL